MVIHKIMNRAKAVNDLKETFAILDADVKEIRKISDKEMSVFHVRTSIRTYSALIEGLLYQMRQVTLYSETDECKVFEFEEKMILNEKTFSLNDNGEVKKKDSFERALPMLLFTLKQYPKIHGATFSPDTSVHGWECMKIFISIRNRIVHPKSKGELELTHDEWRDINLGIDWFYSAIKAMFAECDKADEYFRQESV